MEGNLGSTANDFLKYLYDNTDSVLKEKIDSIVILPFFSHTDSPRNDWYVAYASAPAYLITFSDIG